MTPLRDLSNGSKKIASMTPLQESLLKFVLEAKSTKNIACHGFSTHFYIWTTREAVLANNFF
jgi:hypothetical protein